MALALGGLAGVVVAVNSIESRTVVASKGEMPKVPSLSDRAGNVVDWVDRGLLQLAQREVTAGVDIDTGAGRVRDAGVEDQDKTLVEQRDRLFRTLSTELGIPEGSLAQIRAIVDASLYLGQGNPIATEHPLTRAQCRAKRASMPLVPDDRRICGSPNMVALFDPVREEATQAHLCIDQFEFPNIPCEYPVVWVRASEAARICRILDKRLCDAHEWEGACAGKLLPASKEYESWVNRLNAELFHNQARERVWATGFQPDARTCGTGTLKSPGCVDASWEQCGSNTYPAGAFPRCVSPFGVYDLHGNVAEHMNLPLNESQLGSRGGGGETEMKGSWFAFDEYHPHPDDCRWRAPAWHATAIESDSSHYNYHLGFRCCRDLD